ncbi:MAG: PAP2 family protein, partial [Aureliella sp.]
MGGLAKLRRALWSWFVSRETSVLVALVAVAVAAWCFIAVADEVMEGDTQAFDKWAVRSMRQANDPAVPIGPGWLQEMGRDATALGGIGALVLFTA